MSRTDPRRVGVHEAKTHFSELIRAVEDGEEIVITRGGKPVARLSREVAPLRMASEAFGAYKGQFTIGPEFDEADQEIEDLFYNSEIFPAEGPA